LWYDRGGHGSYSYAGSYGGGAYDGDNHGDGYGGNISSDRGRWSKREHGAMRTAAGALPQGDALQRTARK
jgi:hypothetical protein